MFCKYNSIYRSNLVQPNFLHSFHRCLSLVQMPLSSS